MNDLEAERWVRKTLQDAGKRRALPSSDLAIVKAVAHHEFRKLQQDRLRGGHRRYRNWLTMAAVLLLVVLVGWWWQRTTTRGRSETVATIEVAGGARANLEVGRELKVGETIASDLPLALRLSGGQSVRLDSESEVRLLDASRLRLDRGKLYVDSDPALEARGVRIETAHGTVQEIGTQFEVRVGDSAEPLRVRVREGDVVVETEGASVSATAGEELLLRDDGSVRRRAIPRFGESWEWVQEIAPGLSAVDRTLSEYLHWVGRETGYEIEFEDRDLELSAGTTEVYELGSRLEALPPRDVLDLVLAASGLEYALEDGTVRVRRD